MYVAACESVNKLFDRKDNRLDASKRRIYKSVLSTGVLCPIVIDTGASVSVTPIKEDFVGEILPCVDSIKGLSGSIKILESEKFVGDSRIFLAM